VSPIWAVVILMPLENTQNGKAQAIFSIAHYRCPCEQLLVSKTPLSSLPKGHEHDARDVLGGYLYKLLGQKAEARHLIGPDAGKYAVDELQDPQDPSVFHKIRLLDEKTTSAAVDYLRKINYDPDKAYPNGFSCKLKK